jgi:hypothetical protein
VYAAGRRFSRHGWSYCLSTELRRRRSGTDRASALFWEDEFRGIDLLNPMWHLQDLTPLGRE